ncbi:MAG: hypothetical protein HS108_04935 [Planctomycetes bacterium]|nr:hypothetical protein [Planctomycetota bacterium]
MVPFKVWEPLHLALKDFAVANPTDHDGSGQSGEGDLPSRLMCGTEFHRTLDALQRLHLSAKSRWIRHRAGKWIRRMKECGRFVWHVHFNDLYRNPLGIHMFRRDINPVYLDWKRRRWRRRFESVLRSAQNEGLVILLVSPKIVPALWSSLTDVFRLNALAWSLFADGKGIWESSVQHWCRGQHIDLYREGGKSLWSVHDHAALVLKSSRTATMCDDRVCERIQGKWQSAVVKAADQLGLPRPKTAVHTTYVGSTVQDAEGVARYLTRPPLHPSPRKTEEHRAVHGYGVDFPRCFADLTVAEAEEFLVATRHHRHYRLSEEAKQQTKHFSGKERVPEQKLPKKAQRMAWVDFVHAVRLSASGQGDARRRRKVAGALPHVIAYLLANGLDKLAERLVGHWVAMPD